MASLHGFGARVRDGAAARPPARPAAARAAVAMPRGSPITPPSMGAVTLDDPGAARGNCEESRSASLARAAARRGRARTRRLVALSSAAVRARGLRLGRARHARRTEAAPCSSSGAAHGGRARDRGLRFWTATRPCACSKPIAGATRCCSSAASPERCCAELPEPEQDVVLAGLLRRLWRVPRAASVPAARRDDPRTGASARRARALGGSGPRAEGLRLFEELPRTAPSTSCSRPTCTPATSCARSASRGSRSTRSRSSATSNTYWSSNRT